jgi:hypothetical protein
MGLIPIEDHIPPRALRHQISVHKNGNSPLKTDLNTSGVDWFPSGTRKAIFGRVDFVARALILVITNIEFNRKRASEINSVDIVVYPDGLHDWLIKRTILAAGKPYSRRKFSQRPLQPPGLFRFEAMRREDSSYQDSGC